MSSEGEDHLALRLRLLDYLGEYDATRSIKPAMEFCLQHPCLTDDLLHFALEEIPNVSSSKRKAFVHLLNLLLHQEVSEQWVSAVESMICRNLDQIVRSIIGDQPSSSTSYASSAEIFLQWAESLKIEIDEEIKERLIKIVARGQLSVAEQAEMKRRQGILDLMEKDRSNHKTLRDECWARPNGESTAEEFLSYYRLTKKSELAESALTMKNQIKFLKLNNRTKQLEHFEEEQRLNASNSSEKRPALVDDKKSSLKRVKSDQSVPLPTLPEEQIFVFDIEDSFVYLDSFLSSDAPEVIRSLAKKLDDMIIDIAIELFFYKDLKRYQQPNIMYLMAFDDGRNLAGFDFKNDLLARGKPVPEDPDFKLERAYRSRVMLETYLEQDHLSIMGKDFLKDLHKFRERLDEEIKQLNSLAHSIFALLFNNKRAPIYVIAPRSLPRLFALLSAFGLNPFFRPERIYSSLEFGRHWCLADIKARHPPLPGVKTRFVLCGGHDECGQDGKKLGYEFFKVRGRPDILNFAKAYSLLQ